jgi:hypothetical protein
MPIRTATGLIAWYLRATGFKGWTSFWNTIYVMPGHENNQRLLRHERKHLEQIERDGRLVSVSQALPTTMRQRLNTHRLDHDDT